MATPWPRASGDTARPSTAITWAFSGSGNGDPRRMYPTTKPSISPTRKACGGLSVRKKTVPASWITDGNPLWGDHEILSSRASWASSEARATRIWTGLPDAVMRSSFRTRRCVSTPRPGPGTRPAPGRATSQRQPGSSVPGGRIRG